MLLNWQEVDKCNRGRPALYRLRYNKLQHPSESVTTVLLKSNDYKMQEKSFKLAPMVTDTTTSIMKIIKKTKETKIGRNFPFCCWLIRIQRTYNQNDHTLGSLIHLIRKRTTYFLDDGGCNCLQSCREQDSTKTHYFTTLDSCFKKALISTINQNNLIENGFSSQKNNRLKYHIKAPYYPPHLTT